MGDELLVKVLLGLIGVCLIAFGVVVFLLERVEDSPSAGEDAPSVKAWAISTFLGGFLWLCTIFALLGFGLSHYSASGWQDPMALVLMFGGPLLYLVSAFLRGKAAVRALASTDD